MVIGYGDFESHKQNDTRDIKLVRGKKRLGNAELLVLVLPVTEHI